MPRSDDPSDSDPTFADQLDGWHAHLGEMESIDFFRSDGKTDTFVSPIERVKRFFDWLFGRSL